MKQKDIERLKAICEKEGFQFDWDHVDHSAIIMRQKKDPWEGVEFVEATDTGIIVKVLSFDGERFAYHLRRNGREGEFFEFHKSFFKPSTESAYVDQLKKEAFERFGDIKDGDRFENVSGVCLADNVEGWGGYKYFKNTDSLGFGGVFIYQSGKWAKKLPERVEVEVKRRTWKNSKNDGYDFEFHFNVKNGGQNTNMGDCAIFLSKQLEKYLNKEQ